MSVKVPRHVTRG